MRYKLLGRSGLRVSEICLGTMTFGEEWGYGANSAETEKIFNTYLEAGGNFIDTANRYTDGTSEKLLGELIKKSGKRNELIIASKYSLIVKMDDGINASGNHRKNMMQSVDESLQRLGLESLDIFYLHAWDYTTHIEEVLRAMDDLVSSGKVMYVAISDTPAWIVSRANAIADLRGWNPFVALQIEYSLLQRSVERELIPMANALDLAVVAWAPIAGGALTGKYLKENDDPKRLKEHSKRLSEKNMEIAKTVVAIAKELNKQPSQIAIAWVMQQGNNIIPIAGARNAEQLHENLMATEVEFTKEQLERLDEVSKIELGFPHDFLNGAGIRNVLYGGQIDNISLHRKGF
ncbi:MAG: aldo/keto reductase [Chitinophagales bacterium]|nr:aldo/keto reductase [Bacteroidota bacterium]MBK8680338.1 aldo/keto reductase [Bacteroidota bacterium]